MWFAENLSVSNDKRCKTSMITAIEYINSYFTSFNDSIKSPKEKLGDFFIFYRNFILFFGSYKFAFQI